MRLLHIGLILALTGLLSACGTHPLGGSAGQGTTAPLTLTVTDTPPTGAAFLSFRMDVTGAVLQPGNVPLLNTPVTLELTQLQTDSNFLASLAVPTGTYTSLTLSFANADMTIFNGAGVIPGCVFNAVCELVPTISPVTVTFNTGAFPISLVADTPVGLQLDFSLNNLLSNTFSFDPTAAGGITLSVLPAATATAQLAAINTVAGVITAIGANQFTMKTTGGFTFVIATTTNTTFSFPATTCTTHNFACLAVGQIIATDLSLLGSGSFQANSVTFEDAVGNTDVAGTVVSVQAAANPPTFVMVVHGIAPAFTGVNVDNSATVTVQTATKFFIDADGLTIPIGTFASTSDLVVGQELLVRGNTIQVGAQNAITVSTDQLTLRQSQWTANVGQINQNALSFTLGSLPSLFTSVQPAPITSLNVQTSAQTAFSGLANNSLAGLAPQNPVTVKGPLFNTISLVGAPTVVASQVRGRTSQTLP